MFCRIPKLEGNDLNLHEMYCEVTVRGGIEQVILVSNAMETFQECLVVCIIFVFHGLYIELALFSS